jgi:tetratricopeptide (TPR) repeat protein
MKLPTRWLVAAAALAMAASFTAGALSCTSSNRDDDRTGVGGGTTRLTEPEDAVSEDLMVALAQAKNFHHKAKVYMSDGNLTEAIASVRQILAIQFPPTAPEAEDVRLDARALLAKLLVGQGKVDEAMRVVDEGIASASRDSFFLANLYTVRGEVLEAQAALADDGTADGRTRAADERRAAIAAYDKSIQINEQLQKRVVGGRP